MLFENLKTRERQLDNFAFEQHIELMSQLREKREELGWSQTMAGSYMGTTYQTIARMERIGYTCNAVNFLKYANILGFNVVLVPIDGEGIHVSQD